MRRSFWCFELILLVVGNLEVNLVHLYLIGVARFGVVSVQNLEHFHSRLALLVSCTERFLVFFELILFKVFSNLEENLVPFFFIRLALPDSFSAAKFLVFLS